MLQEEYLMLCYASLKRRVMLAAKGLLYLLQEARYTCLKRRTLSRQSCKTTNVTEVYCDAFKPFWIDQLSFHQLFGHIPLCQYITHLVFTQPNICILIKNIISCKLHKSIPHVCQPHVYMSNQHIYASQYAHLHVNHAHGCQSQTCVCHISECQSCTYLNQQIANSNK